MRSMTPLLLCSTLILAGCGGGLANSWANPGTWFGGSRSEAVDPRRATNPLIPAPGLAQRPKPVYSGVPVDQIAQLRIERRPGGAVIHVIGVTDVIGYYDARLEVENDGRPNDKGVLSYTLRAERPRGNIGVGSDAARQINVALAVTDQDLAGVRQITVRGARNQRSTRRR